MILTICTPLMARAHKEVRQAGEIVFCDSSSSLDRFNTSLFMLSTTTACSGIPLAAFMVSDETEDTVYQALEFVKQVLPSHAFFGNGAQSGPAVFMIDDSIVEHNALLKSWPSARILLWTFHFLQRQWTWLHNAQNKVMNADRLSLIKDMRSLTYCKTESALQSQYEHLLASATTKKYPNFIKHLKEIWEKRFSWAHCYRQSLLIRGNHTNNYAEAGIKIIKEMVFCRVKAYNLVQVFYFITETLELYYKRKLISIANSRLQTYIALRFQGINAKKVCQDSITKSDEEGWYKVPSQTDRSKLYDTNVVIGVCTCLQGKDGSPCAHQAAVVLTYGDDSCNFVTMMSATAKHALAKLALGENANGDIAFYASINQKQIEQKHTSEEDKVKQLTLDGSHWELIRAGATDFEPELGKENKGQAINSEYSKKTQCYDICVRLDQTMNTLKDKLTASNDPQLMGGVKKFLTRFEKLSEHQSLAKLSSAFHQFGSEMGTTKRIQGGQIRHGKRIPIQPTSAGRRRTGLSRGKGKITAGRPSLKHRMPVRRKAKGKRRHSLITNIKLGLQNAGKW